MCLLEIHFNIYNNSLIVFNGELIRFSIPLFVTVLDFMLLCQAGGGGGRGRVQRLQPEEGSHCLPVALLPHVVKFLGLKSVVFHESYVFQFVNLIVNS